MFPDMADGARLKNFGYFSAFVFAFVDNYTYLCITKTNGTKPY